MTNKILTTLTFLMVFSIKNFSCTNFIISAGATTDGSVMITYSADSHVLYGELYFRTARNYPAGAYTDIYEWDSGEFLGKIPQVRHTFSVVGNMNEYQVSIGETTFEGRTELIDTTALIDYGSLMYITLQRATTAREAIRIMDELVSTYGYYSSGESFSIADKKEAWIMEIIGKGPGNKGAVWVARRIPDGCISGHANQSRITTFPLNDPDNCLYAKDVILFARERGYFNGPDEKFSFSDAYSLINFDGARWCDARIWSGFRKVAGGMDQYFDYVKGENLDHRLPLWVKVDRKLTVQDVMGLMRDYFQGTELDMTKDFGAEPYGNIVRWRPLTWIIDGREYFNERAISTQQTGFSFVAQSRAWLPDPVGGILWFGVDDTYSTVYTPMYCGITAVPSGYAAGNGAMMEFSDKAAFWVFNQVSNFAYTRYNSMIPYIQAEQSRLENKYVTEIKKIDDEAAVLYHKKPQKALEYLTAYSTSSGNYTLSEWKKLYAMLFTRFMDGNIKTKVEGQMNPDLEQPGYSEEWYRKVVEATGEKFVYPSTSTP